MYDRRCPTRGFTLIEVTVALGVAVLLFASVVYGVGALTGTRAKESAAELANVIRSLYDTAALSGKTCRLAISLPGEKSDGPVQYHAECAKGAVTASAKRDDDAKKSDRDRQTEKREQDMQRRLSRLDSDEAPTVEELQAREKIRVEESARFSQFSSDDIQERKLPSSVKVEVWTAKQRRAQITGTAYLYFFPQGYTERAQVYVKQGSNTWTIAVSPLTGKTVIHSTALEVPRS